MDATIVDRAARQLRDARLSGSLVEPFSGAAKPLSEANGYAIQTRVHTLLSAAGRGEIVGYKVGATSPEQQQALGLNGPAAGGMFANTAHATGVSLRRETFQRPGVECEIALTLGSDLSGRQTPYQGTDVAGAVATCHAAIEILENRYEDLAAMSAPDLIADDMLNAACVLSPPAGSSIDLAAARGCMTFNGRVVGEGRGSSLMGHPHVVLAWLANQLARNGQPLRAGQVVMCGSLTPLVWLDDHGDGPLTVAAKFDQLGEARVHFL